MSLVPELAPVFVRAHTRVKQRRRRERERTMPPTALAQTFEVVSIRPNTSNDTRQDLGGAPGQMIGSNIPVWWLIRNAYQIDESELIGAPPWVFSDRYDVETVFFSLTAETMSSTAFERLPVVAQRSPQSGILRNAAGACT